MAKPNTPSKNFSGYASQSFWGVESTKRTVTTVLYSGPYIDISKGITHAVDAFLDGPGKFTVKEGQGYILDGTTKTYILHDRAETAKIHNKIAAINTNLENVSVKGRDSHRDLGRSKLFAAHFDNGVTEEIFAAYSKLSREKDDKNNLVKVLQGIYAYKNTYRVNEDVLFGHSNYKNGDLSEWSFVINAPIARSRVPGRDDHIELVGSKYLGNGLDKTSIVISGESERVNSAVGLTESMGDFTIKSQIIMNVLSEELNRSKKIELYRKDDK